MKTFSVLKLALAGTLGLALSACEENGGSFQRDYAVSRNALEMGRFDQAARGYGRLIEKAGRYEPWIRLEYAHALLRSDRYAEAAQEARAVAATQTGTFRSAALAVQGTAEHELGMAATGPDGRARLMSAQAALAEVLKNDPQIDRLGTLRMRKAQIDRQLGATG